MKTEFTPKVSCVFPCFNEKVEILNTSLNSLRNQSFENFECILVDESTNQETVDACKRFCEADARFLYVHPEKRLGLAGSLNLGIQMAKGALIARFDSDDICNHDRLALQVDFLSKNESIGVVGAALEIINSEGIFICFRDYPLIHEDIEKKFITSNALAHPAVIFRKSILDNHGEAYDPNFKYAEDLELWLRLLNRKVKFANLATPLVKYRQQLTNRDLDNWKYNIKARIKNFSSPYRFKKIVAIIGIILWMSLPVRAQQILYRIVQLRKP